MVHSLMFISYGVGAGESKWLNAKRGENNHPEEKNIPEYQQGSSQIISSIVVVQYLLFSS